MSARAVRHDVVVLDRFAPGREEEDLVARLRREGLDADWLDWSWLAIQVNPNRVLVKGRPFEPPAVAVVRSRIWTRHTAGDLALLFDWLEALAELGTRLVNEAGAVRTAKNKVLAAFRLCAAGVPVPAARVVHELVDVGAALDAWGETVVKPTHGHSAVDMVRFPRQRSRDPDVPGGLTSLQEIISWHLLQQYGALCAQEYVPNPGRDVRVIVVGDDVVSANYRIALAPTGEVKNVLHGYREEPAECTPELEDVARRSCRVLGLDCAAIDMLEGPDGLTVVEVNPTVASWSDIDAVGLHRTSHGVGEAFAQLVVSIVNEQTGRAEAAVEVAR